MLVLFCFFPLSTEVAQCHLLKLETNASLASQVRHLTMSLFPFFAQAVLAKAPRSQLLGTSEGRPSSRGGARHKHHQLQWLQEGKANTQKTVPLRKDYTPLSLTFFCSSHFCEAKWITQVVETMHSSNSAVKMYGGLWYWWKNFKVNLTASSWAKSHCLGSTNYVKWWAENCATKDLI